MYEIRLLLVKGACKEEKCYAFRGLVMKTEKYRIELSASKRIATLSKAIPGRVWVSHRPRVPPCPAPLERIRLRSLLFPASKYGAARDEGTVFLASRVFLRLCVFLFAVAPGGGIDSII